MNKLYPTKRNWVNAPSVNTPLGATNLNVMDNALYNVDTRVIELDYENIKSVSLNQSNGVFTFTKGDGSTIEIDTKLEKVVLNFYYDQAKKQLVLKLDDGTEQRIDMSALIVPINFEDSAEFAWTLADGKVSLSLKNGAVKSEKIQPNYLADITVQATKAETAETNAKASEENAKVSEDRAKEYADKAEAIVDIGIATYEKAGIVKPDINSMELSLDGTIKPKRPNKHLLDNPYFRHNSRNVVSVAGYKEYIADRWFIMWNAGGVSVVRNESGIKLDNNPNGNFYLAQRMNKENFFGAQPVIPNGAVYCTVLFDNTGIVVSEGKSVPSKNGAKVVMIENDNFGCYLQYDADSNDYPTFILNIKNENITINAVKLEFGFPTLNTFRWDEYNLDEDYVKCRTSKADPDDEYANKTLEGGVSSVSWDEVKQKPTTFPPSAHTHTKSQITDFPTSLPASDVYSWAKASTKPSYTASEVGARPSTWIPTASDVGLGNVDNTADANKTVNKAGYASSNTVATTSATANLKNIYAGTGAVGSTLPTGVIYIQYE